MEQAEKSEIGHRGMEWTREKTLELLREYQQRRVLWDWNAKGYRDRVKRKRAIHDLAEALRCNTLEVEKKITNLKCQYSREVHKIQNSKDLATGPEDVYISKWFAFKAMQFLQFGSRTYSTRKKQHQKIEDSIVKEEYIVSDIDPESISFMQYEGCNDEETNGSATGSFNNPSLGEYHEEESLSSSLMTIDESYSKENHLNRNEKMAKDDDDNTTHHENRRTSAKNDLIKFGESIALQLAEIPDSYSRSVAKLKINQILFEAEIGVYAQNHGERFDMIIETNKTPGKYIVAIQGLEECRNLTHEAQLSYKDEENSNSATKNPATAFIEQLDGKIPIRDCQKGISGDVKTVCSLDLKGKLEDDAETGDEEADEEIETYYVPFDVHSYDQVDDEMTDYSFNIYSFSYYPTFLSTHTNASRIGQINRMTFEFPSSPILSQPELVPDDTICSIEDRSKSCDSDTQQFCQCTQILQLQPWKTVDIYLIDQGFGGNVSHTFHSHGYHVKVVGTGEFNRPVTKAEIVRLRNAGSLRKNEIPARYSLQKDSFVVPNKGYVVLRIHTDNIGYWLWEARSTGVDGNWPPMQFVMLVGSRENMPTVPIDFPTCGNLKSPASIFEDSD